MERVLHALDHRGPDASGSWSTALPSGATLHLAHTRLRILDLGEAAAQPMILRRPPGDDRWFRFQGPGDDRRGGERLVGVFNGEIYNFRELRAELVARGHEFLSTGDTEVLLRGYAEWGDEVFGRCDGIFAVAIHDSRDESLVVARDHAGIKPLYWAATADGGLAFASEVRALACTGLVDTAVDAGAVADYLRFGSFQEPATVHRGIRAFPAGACARVDLREHRGALPVPVANPGCETLADLEAPRDAAAAQRLHDEALADAVRAQLVADVRVGLFLSGGIDSSLLLQHVPEEERERLTTFTLAGAATASDEAGAAARISRLAGVRHEVVGLSDARLEAWVADALDAMDQPTCDGVNVYLVSRASREAGLVVVLSGCGADELHGAYGHAKYLGAIARRVRRYGPLAHRWERLRAGVARLRGANIPRESLEAVLRAAPHAGAMVRAKRRFLCETEFARLWPCAPGVDPASHGLRLAREGGRVRSAEIQVMQAEYADYLRNTLLRDADWASMANRQELRVPFLGRRYVETIWRIPWALRVSCTDEPKPLLTRSLRPELAHLARMPKRGFDLDYAALLQGPFRERFHAACETLRGRLGIEARPDELLAGARTAGADRRRVMRVWALLALGRHLGRTAWLWVTKLAHDAELWLLADAAFVG